MVLVSNGMYKDSEARSSLHSHTYTYTYVISRLDVISFRSPSEVVGRVRYVRGRLDGLSSGLNISVSFRGCMRRLLRTEHGPAAFYDDRRERLIGHCRIRLCTEKGYTGNASNPNPSSRFRPRAGVTRSGTGSPHEAKVHI